MTKRKLITALIVMTAMAGKGQITLETCKQMARDNYPAVKQYRLIEQSRDYNMANAAKAWLPQVGVSAGANVFTDMLDIAPQVPDGDLGMKNELYNATLQINQTIYDGGATAARRRTIKAQSDVQRERLNVAMYELDGRVEQIFFGIITLDEQIRQNELLQADMTITKQTITDMMACGMANESDTEAVGVELMKARQQEVALKTSRDTYIRMLGTFIGRQIDCNETFERPSIPIVESGCRRPELDYYAAQERLADERRKALDTGLMPSLGVFGTGMYHNKVMSMMKNNLLAAGLTLKWNIGALYTRKNDKRNIEAERGFNDAERQTFLFNNGMKSTHSNGKITALRKQIEMDDRIIASQELIRDKTEEKVKNGTETVNELLRDINDVNEARQTKAVREIELLQEMYNLKNINNN